MQSTSAIYKQILAAEHKVRYRVLMYKTSSTYDTYGMDYITNLKTSHQLFEGGNPNVGNAIAGQIDLRLRGFISEPPKLAKMVIQVQLYIPGTPTVVERLGDVNGDGSCDVVDTLLIAYISSHQDQALPYLNRIAYADIDGDGAITSADVEYLMDYLVGIATPYPIDGRAIRTAEINSEWVTTGTYFIDTREKDELTGEISIHGYDAMLKGEQDIYKDGTYYETWPKTDIEAVEFIAESYLGCEVDERTDELLTRGYSIPFPGYGDNAITARGLLQYIAGINGGNFIITPVGELRFVQLNNLLLEEGGVLITENAEYILFGGYRIKVEEGI